MKVGFIAEPNKKGQIVIPKKLREALGITPQTHLNLVLRGRGIYIYPIDEVVTKLESESPYLAILEKTQGAWADDKSWDKTEERRRKIELTASLRRKKA
ncbi:MAG: AbrB/MazE/SpoVT family DNA-binding domain-containing protein [Patescibacteria group bacterium]